MSERNDKGFKTVLVVDDDSALRENLVDILGDEGYVTYAAASCAEAIESARKNTPRAALLDLKLPDSSGTALLKKIKEILPDCYCVMMTAYADTDSAIAALELGAFHYLQKPFNVNELLQVMERIFATIRLIDEKRQAEEALRESEERFRAIFETAIDAIFIKDRDRHYTFINPAMLKALNLDRERLIGRKDEEILDGAMVDRIRKLDESVFKGEIVETDDVMDIGGTVRTFHVIRAPMRDKDGVIIGYCGVARDITDRLNLEAQLIEAQKMEAIGSLAGGIAHDFNNILGSILGFTELALDDIQEGSVTRRNLEQVLHAGHRAKNLVKQILTFSRKSEMDRKPVEIKPLVSDFIETIKATLPSAIKIRGEMEQETGTILANPAQIHQVLVNLCANSFQAMMEKGGELLIGLEVTDIDSETARRPPDLNPGRYVILKVSDTGAGMEPAVMKRIFEPFFTTRASEQRTGMGLAVVYGIVKDHGGVVTVESKPGGGSTFRIYLPRIEVPSHGESSEASSKQSVRSRILFIDDEQALIDIGKQMLERTGYDVVTQRSSIEALKLFRAQSDRFDLIITDQTMPNITGDVLSQEFLKIRPDIPIIVCTGYSELITEEKAKEIGIREFVLKPVIWREMIQIIKRILDA